MAFRINPMVKICQGVVFILCISVPWLFCAPPILTSACFLYDVTNSGGGISNLVLPFLKVIVKQKKWIEGTISILDSICSVRVFHLYWQFNRKWQKINWLFLPDLLSCIPQPAKEAWESSEDAVAGWAQIWAQFTPPPLKVGHKNVWSNVSKVTSP